MIRAQDRVGEKHGVLTILSVGPAILGETRKCSARCSCGSTRTYAIGNLTSGNTRNCGCLNLHPRNPGGGRKRQIIPVPGVTRDDWLSVRRLLSRILERCENPTDKNYHSYGGRGIRVCEAWRDPANLLHDMGVPPRGMSIDRIDVNGNYEPGNCRWATMAEQNKNKRGTIRLLYAGVLTPLVDVVKATGINYDALRDRMRKGLTEAEGLFAPTSRSRTRRTIVYQGTDLPLHEAVRMSGLTRHCFKHRLRMGWSPEKAISEPRMPGIACTSR